MDPSSVDNFGLHQHALAGDDVAVQNALRQGADVNALDSAGRTSIMCAVAGDNWRNIDASDASYFNPRRLNAIRTIITHPDISLLTLNCPQTSMNGVIPLGMAAWLNVPSVVRLLLEETADCVAVDGMDSHGATALMYAARDGNLEVVQLLLSHGARPDFRDRNYRTSIQFALAHPRILWLLESVLRRHRWRETKSADRTKLSSSLTDSTRLAELAYLSMPFSEDLSPPPASIFTSTSIARLTDTLITAIRRSDISFIHSLLFSPSLPASSPPSLYPMSVPTLVNMPDEKGWSCIHHCVGREEPTVEVLDALYCAGAEVSLFTREEQWTPLHILARFVCIPSSSSSSSSRRPTADRDAKVQALHAFTVHLIQDLRASMAARDKDDETCLHVAVEHGKCVELVQLFIELDTTGSLREMKNSRGLTPIQVARPEFLPLFQQDRPTSSLSMYTIRPTTSFASFASHSELDTFFPSSGDNDGASVCSISHFDGINNMDHDLTTSTSTSVSTQKPFDLYTNIHALLTSLRLTSPASNHHTPHPSHISFIESTISDTKHQSDLILTHFRMQITQVEKMVDDLSDTAERIEEIRRGVIGTSREKVINRGVVALPCRRRNAGRQRDSEDSQVTAVSSVVDGSMVGGLGDEDWEMRMQMQAFSFNNNNGVSSVSRFRRPSGGLRSVHDGEDGKEGKKKVSMGTQTTLLDLFVGPYSQWQWEAQQQQQQRYPQQPHLRPVSSTTFFSDGIVKFVPSSSSPSHSPIISYPSFTYSHLTHPLTSLPTPSYTLCQTHLHALWEIEREMAILHASKPHAFQYEYTSDSSKVVQKYKQLGKKKKKLEEKIREVDLEFRSAGCGLYKGGDLKGDNGGKHEKEGAKDVGATISAGASKVRAWFKKIVVSTSSTNLHAAFMGTTTTATATQHTNNGLLAPPLPHGGLSASPSPASSLAPSPTIPHATLSPITATGTTTSPFTTTTKPPRRRLEIVMDIQDTKTCPVGRSVRRTDGTLDLEAEEEEELREAATTSCDDAIDACIDGALRTSQVVLEAVDRDLKAIGQCLEFARQFIDMANHSVSRTQRVVKRAIKKREALISELHNALLHEAAKTSPSSPHLHPDSSDNGTPGLLGYSMTNRPSLASIATIYSDRSSVISVAATLTENDDDETKIVRRFLLRKIEAQTSGAWDEVDKVMGWLSIVKECVRGVKRRAYL